VLRFENLSGDPDQEYFSDGMVDDIITGGFHLVGNGTSANFLRAPKRSCQRGNAD
jgi:TolB-like protein